MKNIYVMDGELSRKDNTIKLIKDGKITWIPINQIKEINCMGGCTLTNEFLYLSKVHFISVHLYSFHGRYIGSFIPNRHNKNGKVLIHQVDLFRKDRVLLSISVIHALRTNMLNYLDQYRKKGNEPSKVAYTKIKSLEHPLRSSTTVEEVMGIEGISWTYFYEFLKFLYQKEDFFGRKKRPPTDMVNSLISFINTLLYNRIETECSRTDLYTELSFLHSSLQKRKALVLDLAELYKIDVTFRLVGYLVRKKMVVQSDFEMIEGMYSLKADARKIVIKEFERYLQKRFYDHHLKRFVTLEYSIRLEAYKLIRVCVENQPYTPLIIGGLTLD